MARGRSARSADRGGGAIVQDRRRDRHRRPGRTARRRRDCGDPRLYPSGRSAGARLGADAGGAYEPERPVGAIAGQQSGARFSADAPWLPRSEEHTSELQSLMRISYAVFCLKKKITNLTQIKSTNNK